MIQPWDDDQLWRAVLDAEGDAAGGDLALLYDEQAEEQVEEQSDAPADIAASGITSHVFSRSGIRAKSKSTFKPPHTTDGVYTRVAFFTADTVRLVLSDWRNLGPATQHHTKIWQWHYDNARARKALVLWHMNGTTWRSWAD